MLVLILVLIFIVVIFVVLKIVFKFLFFVLVFLGGNIDRFIEISGNYFGFCFGLVIFFIFWLLRVSILYLEVSIMFDF